MKPRKIGHYRVIAKLSEGGMGAVYKAEDEVMGRTVAIKAIKPSHRDTKSATRRFLRESDAIAQIDHPNVVKLLEVLHEGEEHFMVMQFIEGSSLRAHLVEGPLGLEKTLHVACEVGSALEAAHARGIVHRDLKPENILLMPTGVTKILDFGIAHLVDQTTITDDRAIIGTLPYMAPEQVRSEPIDERVDVYGLGMLIFEMVTGRLPFQSQKRAAIIYQILNEDPPLLHTINDEAPEELGRVVATAISRHPDGRYRSMSQMLRELEELRKRL